MTLTARSATAATAPARADRRLTRILAIVALLITLLYLAIFVASASYTLAFDYLAYDAAARRVLVGASPYDLALSRPGEFGLFFYPAPFLLLVLPLTLVPPQIAGALWIGGLVACFIAAILLLPVRDEVRWITLALAGLSWPLIFSVKVGQVAPILVLLFVIGWRWLDRPPVVGIVAALGTLIKIQPVLVFGWLLLERRWRDIAVGVVVVLVASVVATLVVGVAGWTDFLKLMTGLDDPLVQPANFSPGTIAYFLGLSRPLAGVLQYGLAAAVVLLGIWLQRTGTREFELPAGGARDPARVTHPVGSLRAHPGPARRVALPAPPMVGGPDPPQPGGLPGQRGAADRLARGLVRLRRRARRHRATGSANDGGHGSARRRAGDRSGLKR